MPFNYRNILNGNSFIDSSTYSSYSKASIPNQTLLTRRGNFFNEKWQNFNSEPTDAERKKFDSQYKTRVTKLSKSKKYVEDNYNRAKAALKAEYEQNLGIIKAARTLAEVNDVPDSDFNFLKGIGVSSEPSAESRTTKSGKRRTKRRRVTKKSSPSEVASPDEIQGMARLFTPHLELIVRVLSFLPLRDQGTFRLLNHATNQLVRRRVPLNASITTHFKMWNHFNIYKSVNVTSLYGAQVTSFIRGKQVEQLALSVNSPLDLSEHSELVELQISVNQTADVNLKLPPHLERLVIRKLHSGYYNRHQGISKYLNKLAEEGSIPSSLREVSTSCNSFYAMPSKFLSSISGLKECFFPMPSGTNHEKVSKCFDEFLKNNGETLEVLTIICFDPSLPYYVTEGGKINLDDTFWSDVKTRLPKLHTLKFKGGLDVSELKSVSQVNKEKTGNPLKVLRITSLKGHPPARALQPIGIPTVSIHDISSQVNTFYEGISARTAFYSLNSASMKNRAMITWWNRHNPRVNTLSVKVHQYNAEEIRDFYEVISSLNRPPQRVIVSFSYSWGMRTQKYYENSTMPHLHYIRPCTTLWTVKQRSSRIY